MIAAPEGPPCTGFSVGENGDGNVPAKFEECLGDLIRIPGRFLTSLHVTIP